MVNDIRVFSFAFYRSFGGEVWNWAWGWVVALVHDFQYHV